MLELLHKTPKKSAYTIIILLAIFSTIYNAFLPLHGDEAYYWMWSHHLQMGYYDHPPMIAYLIYLTNFISESEWGVRLVNVFSFSIGALYVFKLASEMFDEDIALDAIIIFSSVILVHAGYIMTTTDSPIILFWTLSMYYSYKAIFHGKTKDYILTGIMLGLMMLSKYTAILFVFTLLIFLIFKRRDVFLNPRFYLAIIIALLVVSPMLWWNYQNDWISFGFQMNHGSTDDFKLNIPDSFGFLAGQFGIFSPVFAGLLFFYLAKDKLYYKDNKLFFLSLSIVVILGFFMYKSLFKSMGLNYAAPMYIGGVILLSYIISKYEFKKAYKIGLIIAITFSIIGRIGFMFFLEIVQDRMYGNKEAVHLVQTYAKDGDAFYGDHLTIAAYLKYYLKNHPDTDLALRSRFSQYDMWREKDYLKNGLVLTQDPVEGQLKAKYHEVKLLDSISFQRGIDRTKTFYIYRVKNSIK
ncbi:glycosyltransferase family 39 protein [Sulfurimonas sp.]|uniref:glycosyltransferase family 39 protein n=1 Tax=Sulfurimonas sp. TaxID=2022749 RepID=UPI002AAFF474|nr:glycosyltransferase family 39 protein [Sulfurimonas sp.]